MRARRWLLTRITTPAALLAAWAGCHDPPACYQGDFVGCRCDDGAPGFAACAQDGEGYAACSCEGTPGLQGAGGQGGEGEGGGRLGLFQPCDEDDQCESALCFGFNARGPLCTLPCDDVTDCPSPSPGCNGKGVCKPQ